MGKTVWSAFKPWKIGENMALSIKLEFSFVQHAIITDALMSKIEVLEKEASKDEDDAFVLSETKNTLNMFRKQLPPL